MGKNKNKQKMLDPNQVKKQQLEQAQALIAKEEKIDNNKKAKKVKKTNPNKKKFGTATKETFAELKKVAWPRFGKVVKTTGIVLSVVAIFTVVLLGIDLGLEQLHKLLIK